MRSLSLAFPSLLYYECNGWTKCVTDKLSISISILPPSLPPSGSFLYSFIPLSFSPSVPLPFSLAALLPPFLPPISSFLDRTTTNSSIPQSLPLSSPYKIAHSIPQFLLPRSRISFLPPTLFYIFITPPLLTPLPLPACWPKRICWYRAVGYENKWSRRKL